MSRAQITVLLMLLGGCQSGWHKPGATEDDYARDHKACIQKAQEPAPAPAPSGMTITNGEVFAACMNAHGYTLQQR